MHKRGFCWLITVYLLVLFGAALIAPLFYTLVAKLSTIFQADWLCYLAKKPLYQYIDRLRIVGFICIIPYLLKTAQITWSNLALKINLKTYIRCFLRGCFLWIFLLLCIILATNTIQARADWHLSIGKVFLASLLLAFIEELIFRGFIFEFLHKKHSVNKSSTLLAFLFATLHFSLCYEGKANNFPILLQSLQCAWNSLVSIWGNIHWPYFFALIFLSKILVVLRLHYDSLWAAIGFHQGLVFTLMSIRQVFLFNETQNAFWGTGRLTDAWFVVIVLVLVYAQLKRHMRKQHGETF
jgi:membrane protease YdiL (CAAX protease family)